MVNNQILKATRKECEELFSYREGNRVINPNHKSEIAQQFIKNADLIPPIIINKVTSHVIDGQHRLEAFKKCVDDGSLPEDATISYYFVEVPEEKERETIIDFNTHTKNWSLDDYVHSFSKVNKNYEQLEEWCKSHVLAYDEGRKDSTKKCKFRYGAAIIKGQSCSALLKAGTFSIESWEVEKAEQIHAEMLELLNILSIPLNNPYIESMAISWSQKRNLHDFREWLREFKHKKATYRKEPHNSQKDWDRLFSDVHTQIDVKNGRSAE